MRRFSVACVVALVAGVVVSLALGASGAAPAGRWAILDLGTLGGADSVSVAMSGRGQVVGWSLTKRVNYASVHAFLWDGRTMLDLRTLGGGSSMAVAINERGQVVGSSEVNGGDSHAFLWDSGRMRDLGTLGGENSEAVAINDHGQVVGISETGPSDADGIPISRAFLWEKGRMHAIGPDPRSFEDIEVAGINELGMVAISSAGDAFLWKQGRTRKLGSLGGAWTRATDLNERGLVVGASKTKRGSTHAFVWHNGKMRDLGNLAIATPRDADLTVNERGEVAGTAGVLNNKSRILLWHNHRLRDLGTPGGRDVYAGEINDLSQITALSRTGPIGPHGDPTIVNAFLWQNGKWSRLPTLSTGELTMADAINNKGQIAGRSTSNTGQVHAVLWTWRPPSGAR